MKEVLFRLLASSPLIMQGATANAEGYRAMHNARTPLRVTWSGQMRKC